MADDKLTIFEIAEVNAILRRESEMMATARHLFSVLHNPHANNEMKALAFQVLGDLQCDAGETPRVEAVLTYIHRGLRDLYRRNASE